MSSPRQFARTGMRLALAAVVLVTAAWGQASSPVEEQFAAYHLRLSGVADDLLAAPAASASTAVQDTNVVAAAVSTTEQKFDTALMRVQQLRPLLEPILREEGVPTDVAAVVLVESGGRPTAISPKGALGLWQLMPETARRYGLAVSSGKDERTDVLKATRAAASYLRDLYNQFGDWQLAFAAYNAGEQAVQRAMMRSGSRDFARLHAFLPNETQAYVPAVMTARPLFGGVQKFAGATLRAARTAQVLYASALLND